MRWVLWLFLALPLIELWFIIRVGSVLGGFTTIALLIGAGIVGTHLLRRQGFNTLAQFDQRLQRGELPAEEILGGFVLSLAALLLIIPGFLTDVLAIPLLISPLRQWLVRRLLTSSFYTQRYTTHGRGPFRETSSRSGGDIIDGEYQREDDPRLR
jgi:UPF0716 protein FxsA